MIFAALGQSGFGFLRSVCIAGGIIAALAECRIAQTRQRYLA
jgi:hypothetical protein